MKIIEETGIRRTEDGGIFCEACGNDLSVNGSVKRIAHLDEITYYTNHYECTKCGAMISQAHERSEKERKMWEC